MTLKKAISLNQKMKEDELLELKREIAQVQEKLDNLKAERERLQADLISQKDKITYEEIRMSTWPTYWKKVTHTIENIDKESQKLEESLDKLFDQQLMLFQDSKSLGIAFETIVGKELDQQKQILNKTLDEINIINYNFHK